MSMVLTIINNMLTGTLLYVETKTNHYYQANKAILPLSTIRFWNCSEGVVFLELFRRCGIIFVFHYIIENCNS